MRAAREPSRVFAASDTTDSRHPLWTFTVQGERWYSPRRGSWAFPGADCPVLERAVERLGLEELPTDYQSRGTQILERHLAAPAEQVWLEPEPELFELPVPNWVPQRGDKPPKANVLPGLRLTGFPLRIVPATPVFYIQRRFGNGDWADIEWHLLQDFPVIRSVLDGRPVGLIALTVPGEPETDMTTTARAA